MESAVLLRIEEYLVSFGVGASPGVLEQLDEYVGMIIRWNRRVNLTGLKDPASIVADLLCDAFFLSPRVDSLGRIVDLGSGAGVLAVPLALLSRGITVLSLDKSLRKIQFQRYVKRALGVENLVPVHGRAEDTPPLDAGGLAAKAFGTTEKILRLGAAHLRPGGKVFVLKADKDEPPVCEGYRLEENLRYVVPQGGATRRLFVYRRVREK